MVLDFRLSVQFSAIPLDVVRKKIRWCIAAGLAWPSISVAVLERSGLSPSPGAKPQAIPSQTANARPTRSIASSSSRPIDAPTLSRETVMTLSTMI